MKLKVGNRIRTELGDGTIVEYRSSFKLPYLVSHDDFDKGHNGNGISKNIFTGNKCLWYKENDLKQIFTPTVCIFQSDEKTVVALLKEDGKVLRKGLAKCNDTDEFSFETGAKLAFDRLMEKKESKPQYYNGKVICVNALPLHDFTVGKVYKVMNGQFKDDTGINRPKTTPVNDLQALNNAISSYVKFIEFKGETEC